MIYLYIKTHNVTGVKYLGKTIQNPYVYKGSGKRWLAHLKKHGNDVTTEIIGTYVTINELRVDSINISEKYDIVNSRNWANLRPETGDGGNTSQYINYSNLNRGKGQTYEERYGKEKAIELKKLRKKTLGRNSSARKGKTLIELYGEKKATEITYKNSEKHKGKTYVCTEERKHKISKSKKGKPYEKKSCLICSRLIGINNLQKHLRTHISQ